MNTDTIIRRLGELGVTMTASGDRLDLRPGSRVPDDLQVAVRLHKAALLDRLAARVPTDEELAEIVRQVREQGHVCLWSHVLSDFVAFVQTDEDAKVVPRFFTVYTAADIMEVFGDETPDPGSLKLIHESQKARREDHR